MSIINRLGTFFIWLGAAAVMVFILSDVAHSPIPVLLFVGLICVVLGFYLWWRDPPQPSQPSNRFRILKKQPKTKGNAGSADQPGQSRRRKDRDREAEPPPSNPNREG